MAELRTTCTRDCPDSCSIFVTVVNWAGRVRARLRADREVRRDVLLLNPARWRGDLSGVNQLREAIVTDLGDSAAMHETRVRLER